MLSQTVEYALRAMVCLANAPETSQTRTQLVAQTQVPKAYLAKVMNDLCRAGLASAQRGKNGGFQLARPADRITLLDVVDSVEPLQRIETCPLNIRSHGTRLCPLHRRVDEATATLIEYFRGVTLAQIVAEKSGSIPLCADGGPTLVQLG
jgi:Rrf2 family protein